MAQSRAVAKPKLASPGIEAGAGGCHSERSDAIPLTRRTTGSSLVAGYQGDHFAVLTMTRGCGLLRRARNDMGPGAVGLMRQALLAIRRVAGATMAVP
jgi:hypothetical protein